MVLEKVYDELISMIEDLRKQVSGGVGGSVDYNTEIENLPKVNNITVKGNKKSSDLKIAFSMTEAEYAAATKNAESIYCLQENAAEVIESDDLTGIEWTQSGVDYVATVSYTPSNQNVTGVTSVTCDSDTITIESYSLVDGAVVTLISTTDPAEVPESVEFTFTMTQPIGATRIVKNGVEFGKTNSGVTVDTLWTGTQSGAATDVDSLGNLYEYDAVMCSYYNSDDASHVNYYTPVAYLFKEGGDARWVSYPTYGNRTILLNYDQTKPSKINVFTGTYSEQIVPVVTGIYGIKY